MSPSFFVTTILAAKFHLGSFHLSLHLNFSSFSSLGNKLFSGGERVILMEGSKGEAVFDSLNLNPQLFINEALNIVDDLLDDAFDFYQSYCSFCFHLFNIGFQFCSVNFIDSCQFLFPSDKHRPPWRPRAPTDPRILPW